MEKMRIDVLESQTPTRMFIGQNEPDNRILTACGMTVKNKDILRVEPNNNTDYL